MPYECTEHQQLAILGGVVDIYILLARNTNLDYQLDGFKKKKKRNYYAAQNDWYPFAGNLETHCALCLRKLYCRLPLSRDEFRGTINRPRLRRPLVPKLTSPLACRSTCPDGGRPATTTTRRAVGKLIGRFSVIYGQTRAEHLTWTKPNIAGHSGVIANPVYLTHRKRSPTPPR